MPDPDDLADHFDRTLNHPLIATPNPRAAEVKAIADAARAEHEANCPLCGPRAPHRARYTGIRPGDYSLPDTTPHGNPPQAFAPGVLQAAIDRFNEPTTPTDPDRIHALHATATLLSGRTVDAPTITAVLNATLDWLKNTPNTPTDTPLRNT